MDPPVTPDEILAIDPGPTESAYVLIDTDTRRPVEIGKVANDTVRTVLASHRGSDVQVVIEMVASYGMAVGADVFETCVWIGRFLEQTCGAAERVFRRDVKLHHCHSAKAKDGNIAQALVDRFALGVPNRGKGTKAAPGWFYGFHDDIWQAYALAVVVADQMEGM